MVLKILKKRKVPDELPDLATDEIEKKLDKIKDKEITKETEIKDELKQQPKKEIIKEPEVKNILEKTKEKPKIELIKEESKEKSIEPEISETSFNFNKNGFFTELGKSLNKYVRNADDLENWYNKKILSRDTISDMKIYWEKQKNSAMMEILGKNLQDKISEKTTKLEALEKEWQKIYFELLEKEEHIRNEEKELKKLLSDFVEKSRKNKEETEIDDKMNQFFEIESNDQKNKIIKIM